MGHASSGGGSCVACLGTAAAGCSGTDVCSTATPNTCVAVGSNDATCAAIDTAKPAWSTVSTACVAAGSSDGTCAAIDADKSKWLVSGGGSCVACLGTAAAGCGGTDVCSTATPNTCVAVGSSDATCAAIDTAKPAWSTVATACVA